MTLPRTSKPLENMTIDGRYAIERVLGEGGMGRVYEARHVVLGKLLAVKVLRPDVSQSEETIARFRREAQSASSIGNQHIIDISDFGTLPDGSTYFVMEHLDGRELTDAIDEAPNGMEIPLVLHVARQLAVALGAAHANGIIHRDLKPDNVHLVRRGRDPHFVKVLDFGLAKVASSRKKLTQAGRIFGTPHYMSPEQCSGQVVDPRTDIYALGVMLFEMLTGRWPFDSDSLTGILTAHIYEPVPTPSAIQASIPAGLDAIVTRCLAKEPSERFQTMEALEAALAAVATAYTHPPVGASGEYAIDEAGRLSRLSAVGATRALGTALPRVSSVDRSERVTLDALRAPAAATRRRMISAGLALALLGLVSGGAAWAMKGENEPAPIGALTASPTPHPVAAPGTEPVARGTSPAATPEEPAAGPNVAPARRTMRIASAPEGAEVYAGDVIVGVTPLELPFPESRLVLEFRKPGYARQTLALSELTLTDEVEVELAPEPPPRRSVRRRVAEPQRSPENTPAPMRPAFSIENIRNPWE